MTLVKRLLTWFILWTSGYLLHTKLVGEILSKECINYNKKKLKKLSLVYSLVTIIFILSLYKKKTYQTISQIVIDIINVSMLSIASSLDLLVMKVETYFLRIVLLASILVTRRVNIVSFSLNASVTYMILYMLYQVSRGSIGGADVRILTILAFGYGFTASMLILTYAAWICLIVSLLVYLFKRRDRKQEIAFVPYIYLAYIFLVYSYKI